MKFQETFIVESHQDGVWRQIYVRNDWDEAEKLAGALVTPTRIACSSMVPVRGCALLKKDGQYVDRMYRPVDISRAYIWTIEQAEQLAEAYNLEVEACGA